MSINEYYLKKCIVYDYIGMNSQIKTYHYKVDAINDIQRFHNSSLKLFSSDISDKGVKQFHLFTYDQIFERIYNKNTHYYENYELNQPIKLFIDLDCKTDDLTFNNLTFDELITNAITIIMKKLKDYGYDDNTPFIILKADSLNKLSSHIIFPTVIFKSINIMKSFMSELNQESYIDKSVYKVGCFRMLHCSKMNKNNKLYYYESTKIKTNYNFTSDKQLFLDSLLLNISSDIQYISYEIPEIIKVIDTNQRTNYDIVDNYKYKDIDNDYLVKLLELIDISRWDDYDTWIRLGVSIKNHSNNFEIFDKFSSRSGKYKGYDDCLRVWNSFKHSLITIGTIIWYAKIDSPDEYKKLISNKTITDFDDNNDEEDELIKNTIFIDAPYIIEKENNNMRSKSCKVSNEFDIFINHKIKKCFCVFSGCDTGKSSFVRQIMRDYIPTKVLYVSYRKSLTNNIHGNLDNYNFKSYLDGNFTVDRLICQVDSLLKINNLSILPEYDLVIFDEIESILNHFQASTLKDSYETFTIMKDIAICSKKIIFLDGDFSNRTYNYIKHFDPEPVIIKNTCIKKSRHFIFDNNFEDFKTKINTDMLANKKVVIVSMSSNLCHYFEDLYKKNYKIICHTSECEPGHLDKLKKVNEYWNTCDLLIYSPCVEAGVDFNLDYFDNMYCILSDKSCSPRSFIQMIYRIRNIKNNDIHCFRNNIKFEANQNILQYHNVNSFFYQLYPEAITKNLVINGNLHYYKQEYKTNIYYETQKYNLLEHYNKLYFFIPVLLKLLTDKGHTWINNETKIEIYENVKCSIIKDRILNTDLVDEHTYDDLLDKQKRGLLTLENKYQIQKYIYMKTFKIDILTAEIMDKIYGQIDILYNFRYLINKKKYITDVKVKHNEDLFIDSDDEEDEDVILNEIKNHKDIKIAMLSQKKILCLKLLETIGFSLKHIISYNKFDRKSSKQLMDNKILIPLETFEKNIKLINNKNYKKYFFTKNNKLLFDIDLSHFYSIKKFLGAVNTILGNFGLKIRSKQYSIRVNGNVVNNNFYMLCLNELFIDLYLKE